MSAIYHIKISPLLPSSAGPSVLSVDDNVAYYFITYALRLERARQGSS